MTATAEKTALVQTPDRLIALAIEHGADVDRLGKLMDLQERWQAGQARMAYFDALSRFQSACPNIPKTKAVKNRDGSDRYKYAPLDSIIKTLREPLQKHGFSYRWQTDHAEDSLRVTCYLMHRRLPPDRRPATPLSRGSPAPATCATRRGHRRRGRLSPTAVGTA